MKNKDTTERKDDLQVTIIRNVKSLMQQHGINQVQLSEQIGIKPAALSRMLNEAGDLNISLTTLVAIADVFNFSVDSLLGRDVIDMDPGSLRNQYICNLIVNLYYAGEIGLTTASIDEIAYADAGYDNTSDLPDGQYPFVRTEVTSDYTVLYFPYYRPMPLSSESEDYNSIIEEYSFDGNDNPKGREMAEFLKYFYALSELREKGIMPEDIFQTAIRDRIKQLEY